MNGIDCLIVRYSDYENDDNSHLWNVVKLDGKWYQLDAMADDPECPGLINYDYFLVGTETLVSGVPFLETEAHEYETDYGLTFEKEASPYSKQPLPEYYYWTFGGNEFPKIFKYSDTIFEANGLNLRFTPESYEVIYNIVKKQEYTYPDFFSFKVEAQKNQTAENSKSQNYFIGLYFDEFDVSERFKNCLYLESDAGLYFIHDGKVLPGEGSTPFDGSGTYSMTDLRFTVSIMTEGRGSVSGGGTYTAGDNVSLRANPYEGYEFIRWESSDTTITNDSFTMPAKEVTVKAVFEHKESPSGDGNTMLYLVAGIVVILIIAGISLVVVRKRNAG